MRKFVLCSVAALATTALVVSGTTAAAAGEADDVASPVVGEVAPPVEIATSAAGAAVTSTATGGIESAVTFELPGESATDTVDLASVPADLQSGEGQPISSTELDGALLTSYESEHGVQTLIRIADEAAPTEYAFSFDLAEGNSLALQPDGSVFVNDTTGLPSALIDVPWAFDANGAPVPTSFRIDGTTVVQVIDTSGVSAFPVIADPDLWWIVANSAGCLAEIAGLSLVGAKAIQVFTKADKVIRAAKALGKYYDALGGKVDKVIGVFKKWINNKKSLNRKQLTALEGLMREGAKLFFNAVGLGTCYNLVRGS